MAHVREIRSPSSSDNESGIQYLESGTHESRIQAGVYMRKLISGGLFDFASRLHDDWVISYLVI